MGVVALRSESDRTDISSWGKVDMQEKCCSSPDSNLDFPIDEVHWRIDSTSRVVVETTPGFPASVTCRSLRYSRRVASQRVHIGDYRDPGMP